MHPVTSLTIVYDASCRLCTRLKVWIGRQPSVICLRFASQWLGRSADEVSESAFRRACCSCRDGGGVARQSCRDCLSVGVERPPRPCRQVDRLLLTLAREAFRLYPGIISHSQVCLG